MKFLPVSGFQRSRNPRAVWVVNENVGDVRLARLSAMPSTFVLVNEGVLPPWPVTHFSEVDVPSFKAAKSSPKKSQPASSPRGAGKASSGKRGSG